MKKIVSIALVLVMALTLVALTACGGEETTATTRFGLGVITNEGKATDFKAAEEEGKTDTKGAALATYTACILTIDENGKITAAKFDAFEGKVEYDGTGVGTVENLTSKYALGDAYGMKTYAGSTHEWYEQADAFASKLVGKTEGEIASLMATTGDNAGKGTDDVIAAGCTVYVSDFVKAAQAAYTVAKAATAVDGTVALGTLTITSTKTITNATAEANGTGVITTVIEGVCGTSKTTVTYTATAGFTAAGVAGGETITVAEVK